MSTPASYDVVVVGASAAGCTAARFLALKGLKVALIERHQDPSAYKKVCTHFLHPCARRTLERLGVVEALKSAGARPNPIRIRSRFGWIEGYDAEHGLNIRRQTLDPILRRAAAETEGVTLFLGHSATGLVRSGDRITGVTVAGSEGAPVKLRARLVVAADGSGSKMARWAEVPTVTEPNQRFVYFTHYRGLAMPKGSAYWYMEPDLAYAFPNDGDVTIVGVFLPIDQLPQWRGDIQHAFERYWARLPDAPRLESAEQVCEMRGLVKQVNVSRSVAYHGMALVGDAAFCVDPIWGTGCTWAICSGEWLARAVGDTLRDPASSPAAIDRALLVYRLRHWWETQDHWIQITNFAQGRPLPQLLRWFMSATTRDKAFATHVLRFISREIGLLRAFSPWQIARGSLTSLLAALRGVPVFTELDNPPRIGEGPPVRSEAHPS